MNFTQAVIAVSFLFACLTEPRLLSQTLDASTLANRLDAAEERLLRLDTELAELRRLLRPGLPPVSAPTVANGVPFELSIAGAPTKGSADAQVVLVEFSDFLCPFCARHFQNTYPELDRLFIQTGKIRYVFRNLPLVSLHPFAFKAAEAAVCADGQGKFWEMHARLFANPRRIEMSDLMSHAQALALSEDPFRSCLTDGPTADKINFDLSEAQRLGLEGTPAFLIGRVTGDRTISVTQIIRGAHPIEVFTSALERALAVSATTSR